MTDRLVNCKSLNRVSRQLEMGGVDAFKGLDPCKKLSTTIEEITAQEVKLMIRIVTLITYYDL